MRAARESRGAWTATTVVRLAAAAWLALGALAGAGPAAAAASAAASPQPVWAAQCGSAALGLDTVQLAPVLPSDTLPGGRAIVPQPLSSGKWVPVIMVHGWASRDTHDGTGAFDHDIDLSDDPAFTADVGRSLIGQLQRIPGAAVFTFDYHPYSARWVDDPHLGPVLGAVIDCLYRASGEKVIIVAHSMGGLVARYAATHPGVAGADRSGEISSVVTFGTPEGGSVAALLLASGVKLGAADNDLLAILRFILSYCGQQASTDIETGSLCQTLPAPARAFASSAGIALRTGSPQLAALKSWPHAIKVTALAGNITLNLPDPGWFSLPWGTTSVDVGDGIVTQKSALAEATSTGNATCQLQLNPLRGAADKLLVNIGWESQSQVAQSPLSKFAGYCFHTSLMRLLDLTNHAYSAVIGDIQSRQSLPAIFHGEWYVHGGVLCVGGVLQLTAANTTPACPGNGTTGWEREYAYCQPIPPGTIPVCYELKEIAFSLGPGNTIIGTITKVLYTTTGGSVLPDFNPGPGYDQPGDTFQVTYVTTGLLKETFLQTHLSQANMRGGGSFNWCSLYLKANTGICGA